MGGILHSTHGPTCDLVLSKIILLYQWDESLTLGKPGEMESPNCGGDVWEGSGRCQRLKRRQQSQDRNALPGLGNQGSWVFSAESTE